MDAADEIMTNVDHHLPTTGSGGLANPLMHDQKSLRVSSALCQHIFPFCRKHFSLMSLRPHPTMLLVKSILLLLLQRHYDPLQARKQSPNLRIGKLGEAAYNT